jgi:hypothetical protein
MPIRLRQAIPFVLAVLASLSVLALNGRPLFYFDSGAYLAQGSDILSRVGLAPKAQKDGAPGVSGAPAAGAAPKAEDKTVVASRSATYGLILALVLRFFGPTGFVAVNLMVIWLPTWLLARQIVAQAAADVSGGSLALPRPVTLAALMLCLGALGSLPFYVAYLMPDIFAPALILIIALITAYGRVLGWRWLALAAAVAGLAVLAHPSHLLIAAIMLPAALLLAPRAKGRRGWVMVALVVLLLGGGLAERAALGLAIEKILHKRVLYMPFLTARLIDDGPGFALLQERCPDPDYPTCALYSVLLMSDDPARFDAPNILFARNPRVASFAILPESEKEAVANAQTGFVMDVLVTRPGDVLASVARNTLTQLVATRVDMTIPTESMGGLAAALSPAFPTSLADGGLVRGDRGWLDSLATFHQAVYALSAAVVAAGLVVPRLLTGFRPFLAMCVIGILANAVVCGAVSEPADRYGARVAFLLPELAGLVLLLLWSRRRAGAVSPA